jgi:DUF3048 family protein
VTFVYDPATNRYLRFMDGSPRRDASDGAQIAPSNVVVLTIASRVVDKAGRLELDQVGTGKALFLIDGRAIEGAWSKASEAAPTRLLDRSGRSVLLNRGQTWIQIVPTEAIVEVAAS